MVTAMSPVKSLPLVMTTTRLRYLAQEVHALGPRGLYELFSEIIAGASPTQSIERYGRLSFDYGDFIRALGGDQLRQRSLLLAEATNDFHH